MCTIYLAIFDNILRAFDSDTCYIIYTDAGYIFIRLYIGKSTKKIPQEKYLLETQTEE